MASPTHGPAVKARAGDPMTVEKCRGGRGDSHWTEAAETRVSAGPEGRGQAVERPWSGTHRSGATAENLAGRIQSSLARGAESGSDVGGEEVCGTSAIRSPAEGGAPRDESGRGMGFSRRAK